MTDQTDWDAYYKQPVKVTSITRKISAAKIQGVLAAALSQENISICELGGANSCFADHFLERNTLKKYHVIDSNNYGVELLLERFAKDDRVTAETLDVLTLSEGHAQYDIVYSVGLIEHFDKLNTKKCIEGHFHVCNEGGLILMTFPTPTLLYRIIRSAAELMGIWKFPDERPLSFREVEAVVNETGGTIIHHSINWWIGLTQGYLLIKK